MKNLKNNLSKMLIIMSVLFVFSSCKKDKNAGDANGLGTYEYQGKTNKITLGDYRKGNGDGAWIYLTGEGYTEFVQIRFSKLGNYVIPLGTFTYKAANAIEPYNPAKNFSGGLVISESNVNGDEITGGTVTIGKDGDNYTITLLNVTTNKGSLNGNFSGTLKQI